MYKLIQLKKQLSFEEICPKHSITLGRWDRLTDKEKSKERSLLCRPNRCFVGEAHGGSDYIGCSKCFTFSSFTDDGLCGAFDIDYLRENGHPDWVLFEQRKSEFVKHFNECHVTDTGAGSTVSYFIT